MKLSEIDLEIDLILGEFGRVSNVVDDGPWVAQLPAVAAATTNDEVHQTRRQALARGLITDNRRTPSAAPALTFTPVEIVEEPATEVARCHPAIG
jgi:hypothetical protein